MNEHAHNENDDRPEATVRRFYSIDEVVAALRAADTLGLGVEIRTVWQLKDDADEDSDATLAWDCALLTDIPYSHTAPETDIQTRTEGLTNPRQDVVGNRLIDLRLAQAKKMTDEYMSKLSPEERAAVTANSEREVAKLIEAARRGAGQSEES